MMSTAIRPLAFTAFMLFAGPQSLAESADWSQFRGPAGSGIAEAEHPPIEIGPDKNVRWKVAVPSGALVADRRGRQARAHRLRRRQALHDRLQSRRRQRSLASSRAGQGNRTVSQDRRQPGRVDAGERRRADRLVLRLVRPVLLRPGRPRAVAARDADGEDGGRLRHRRVADPGRRHRRAAARRDEPTRRSSPSTRRPARLKWETEARIEVGLRHAGRLGYARRASKSSRPVTAG